MTTYEMGKYWLLHTLESYRDTPPGELGRRFIDRLIEGSRNAAGDSPEEKRLHNLIVLRYITGTRPTTQRICAALHMGRQRENYEAVTANAVNRLLVLAFGADGIDWNESEQMFTPPPLLPKNLGEPPRPPPQAVCRNGFSETITQTAKRRSEDEKF